MSIISALNYLFNIFLNLVSMFSGRNINDDYVLILSGERPHHCTECEQRFTTRCQLSRHIQGVHRCAKKHKCLVCGKEFLYSTNFKGIRYTANILLV
jgi:hypothetical protein